MQILMEEAVHVHIWQSAGFRHQWWQLQHRQVQRNLCPDIGCRIPLRLNLAEL
jgi:hypothetical protein